MRSDVILVIDKSELIRSFLKEKLEKSNFEVYLTSDGHDGLIKMRNKKPDLVIIDYQIAVDPNTNFMKERTERTLIEIPIIMLGKNLDVESIIKVAQYKTFRFLTKPINIEQLFSSISRALKRQDLVVDNTPCSIDVHYNEDTLMIEVARGLNEDRIDTLKYRINEIKKLYHLKHPKVLLILIDIFHEINDLDKLYKLFDTIFEYATNKKELIAVLSPSREVKDVILNERRFHGMFIAHEITEAIGKLNAMPIDQLLASDEKAGGLNELNWNDDKTISEVDLENETVIARKPRLAVVDDEKSIQNLVKAIFMEKNWDIVTYNDGRDFLNNYKMFKPDLLLLDLMMPNISGFEVLEELKKKEELLPTIVFSSLSKMDTVKRVMAMGIRSYIVKPFHPDTLLKKATEVMESNF